MDSRWRLRRRLVDLPPQPSTRYSWCLRRPPCLRPRRRRRPWLQGPRLLRRLARPGDCSRWDGWSRTCSSRGSGRRAASVARYHPSRWRPWPATLRRRRPSPAGTRRERRRSKHWTRTHTWCRGRPPTMCRSRAPTRELCWTARCALCRSLGRASRGSRRLAATARASTACAATWRSRSWRVASSSSVPRVLNDFTRTTSDVCSATTPRSSSPSTKSLHCDDCWFTTRTPGGVLLLTAGTFQISLLYMSTSTLARSCFWSSVFVTSTIFVSIITLPENCYIYHYETYTIDCQWLCVHAIKFTRWQHPEVGRGASYDVPGTVALLFDVLFRCW